MERRPGDRRKDNQLFQKEPAPHKKKNEDPQSDLLLLDNVPDPWWSRLWLLAVAVFFLCMLLLIWIQS